MAKMTPQQREAAAKRMAERAAQRTADLDAQIEHERAVDARAYDLMVAERQRRKANGDTSPFPSLDVFVAKAKEELASAGKPAPKAEPKPNKKEAAAPKAEQ